MHFIIAVLAFVSYTFMVLWVGMKFGGRVANWELQEERKVSAMVLKERNELRTNLDRAKKAVTTAGLDVKRIFPWLVLMLAVQLSACLRPAYAQGASAVPLPSGTFYSPERNLEALDVAALQSARTSIDLAAFSLTDQAVVTALKDRAAHGVQVRIYLDRSELETECRGDILCTRIPLQELIGLPGVEIRVKFSKVLMHLKSYEVDGALLRDGSANFSLQGETRQDNSVVFCFDPGALPIFTAKFQAMWSRPDNLTVAQAVTGAKK
jgi:hypothetical protein